MKVCGEHSKLQATKGCVSCGCSAPGSDTRQTAGRNLASYDMCLADSEMNANFAPQSLV